MVCFRPAKSAWMPLLPIGGFPIAIGIGAILDDAWLAGAGGIVLGAVVIGYNATIRLVVDRDRIALRRFGRTVWTSPTQGVTIEQGRAGDIAVIPAYLFLRDGRQIGYVLRSWFTAADMATAQSLVDASSQPSQVG